jgi:YidC/Oxa1 family membrane protein insertase
LQARSARGRGAVRLGFTVSRQVGNAVERNRVRRRLREIVRLSAAAPAGLKAGHDYVLIGRRAALASTRRASPAASTEGRAHRRSVAGAVPRHRRSELAGDRAVLALGYREPYYAEFGWVPASGTTAKIPDQIRCGSRKAAAAFRRSNPVTLKYDNGDGLTFRRTIAIDDRYLFTIKDDVTNVGNAPVTLYPFALISRHGTPKVSGYYILHEGLIGYLGDQGLQEYPTRKSTTPRGQLQGHQWLARHHRQILGRGAAAGHRRQLQARFSSGEIRSARCDLSDRLSAGSADHRDRRHRQRQCAAVRRRQGSQRRRHQFSARRSGGYNKQLDLNHFDLLIDWGWFYFITKPMFLALDFFYHLVGNFGIAILLVTVLVKLLFFPLANKSYASMAKMKSVQPQLAALKERYPDDKVKQQQEMMEIYKKEKINPIAGCLPVALQIPVFFSLYKVLFVTIEMRHAPFYGWIKDLSAPDPTNLFTLFGLFHSIRRSCRCRHYLALGIWPIIMGITMWFQMKLNPTPPDPTQKMIFNWMPLIFTFMLAASRPAW